MARRHSESEKAWQQSDEELDSELIASSSDEDTRLTNDDVDRGGEAPSPRQDEGPGYAQFLDSDDEQDLYSGDEDDDNESETETHPDGQFDADNNDRQEKNLRRQIEGVPFSVLLKARRAMAAQERQDEEGNLSNDDEEDEFESDRRSLKQRQEERERREIEKRENKHAPTELSSRRPVSRKRQIVDAEQSGVRRDPRFSSLSASKANAGLFRTSYGFLHDQQSKEVKQLRQTLSQLKRQEAHHAGPRATSETALAIRQERERVEQALRREEGLENERRQRQHKSDVLRRARKQIDERVKQGGKRFHLKESEKKRLVLQDKFERLANGDASSSSSAASSRKGGLQRAMERRRKKNAAKDRLIPLGGGGGGGGGAGSALRTGHSFTGTAGSMANAASIPKRKRINDAATPRTSAVPASSPRHSNGGDSKPRKRGKRG